MLAARAESLEILSLPASDVIVCLAQKKEGAEIADLQL